MANNRAKYGYLSYNDMFVRIEEGLIDEYDVVFTIDTNECYIIKPDLTPSSIRSRVYVFDSYDDALIAINENTDTYDGQLVSILTGDSYRGYIVNKVGDKYTVNDITDISHIDYDTLGNRPVNNLIGTFENPIILDDLPIGLYSIKGQYKISNFDETTYLGASYIIFSVNHENSTTYIKKIGSSEIVDYKVTGNVISSNIVITKEYLKTNGYATEKYVNDKIAALDFMTTEETKKYVQELVKETVGKDVEAIVDKKIDEKIQTIASDEISTLFA